MSKNASWRATPSLPNAPYCVSAFSTCKPAPTHNVRNAYKEENIDSPQLLNIHTNRQI